MIKIAKFHKYLERLSIKQEAVSDKFTFDDWELKGHKLISKIKAFKFESVEDLEKFIEKVDGLSKKMNHHAVIKKSKNNVRFEIWTHSVGGVTKKDFELAKKISLIKNF